MRSSSPAPAGLGCRMAGTPGATLPASLERTGTSMGRSRPIEPGERPALHASCQRRLLGSFPVSDSAVTPLEAPRSAPPVPRIAWPEEPPNRFELLHLLSDDETATLLERHLVRVARSRGAVELAIGEGLL